MSGSPKVLFVITSTNRRGAEVEGSAIAAGLSARGMACEVVALAPGTTGELLDVALLGTSVRALSTLWALRRQARGVDLVVAYGSSTLPACALALLGTHTPFIYRSIGDPGRWVRGRVHRARTGLLMRRATHVVALWPAAGEVITELYGVDADRTLVVPNARDADHFRPPTPAQGDAARARFGVSGDAPVALVLGSLTAEKCVHIAIEAASQVPGLRLLVAGDGPRRGDLASLASRLMPGRCTFLGPVADVLPVLHAADLILLTSRTEGLPGALIEAGMCGLPAVATDVGGVSQIVIDGVTGILVPVGDVAATASKIGLIVARRSGDDRPCIERGLVDRFGLTSVLDAWEELLRCRKGGTPSR